MSSSSSEFVNFSYERAVGAQQVKCFSNRGGKLVEHVRDAEGDFVRRIYAPDGIGDVVSAGLSFSDAWSEFNTMFETAGINVVPSTLVEETADDLPIIVTKYLGNLDKTTGFNALPIDSKVEIAGNIGKLLTASKDFLPRAKGFMPDTFAIDRDTGELVMVDVDPYLRPREYGFSARIDKIKKEDVQGAFMVRFGWNLAEWAINDEERQAMATAFVRTAGQVLADDSGMELINRFGYVHFMANGMTPEQLKGLGY